MSYWTKTPSGRVVHVNSRGRLSREDWQRVCEMMDRLAPRYGAEGDKQMAEQVAVASAPAQAVAQPTKTVWCNSNKQLTGCPLGAFVDPKEAIAYANKLLKAGHKARLADWKPPNKSAVDRAMERSVEQYPDGPPWLRGR